MGECFICHKETEKTIEGRTHVPPIGNYKIYLCDGCKENMNFYRDKLREEVVRQVSEYV